MFINAIVLHMLAILLRNSAFKFPLVQKLFVRTKYFSLAATRGAVSQMTVKELSQILKGDERSLYQIVDVREPNELEVARISGEDIINLPLGSANVWSSKVQNGELLDNAKPTICLCHHGGRSMKVASFLVGTDKFDAVYNVQGGIHEYSLQVDPSIPTY